MTRIMVIEDEVNILENIVETLEMEGFEARGMSDGRECLSVAKSYEPDLVLCDIMMPEFDGYNVLMTLRSDVQTSTVPFIFLTALAGRSNMRQGMELGADDYLTKPFTPSELVAAINTRLEKAETNRKKQEMKMAELRNNIIYALPHELRTPLTGLIGCADLIQMDAANIQPERLTHLADVMMRSAKRLEALVENYLLYAQLEIIRNDPARVAHLRKNKLDYPEMLLTEVTTIQGQNHNRANDIKVTGQSATIGIAHDNFRKAMMELVDNAFKFSKPGTPIEVNSNSDGNGFYEVRVVNKGRGMSAEQIASIGAYIQFERKLYEQQGLGLGLVIAKRLLEIHGGELTIKSVPGETTEVIATFPVVTN